MMEVQFLLIGSNNRAEWPDILFRCMFGWVPFTVVFPDKNRNPREWLGLVN